MKTVNSHELKIDVVKFDGMNNFDMWRCEMMDALTASNLKDSLLCEKKLLAQRPSTLILMMINSCSYVY